MTTKEQLKESIQMGIFSLEETIEDYIKDSIIDEDYNDEIALFFIDCIGNDCTVYQKISDYITPEEYKNVISSKLTKV